jgi:signal transduction histidine kinase
LVYLKLQRVHARDRERARIARDLHDDLGANLSEIAMMSELAKDELPADDPTRAHFGEISERASSNVRRLSDIVWAINPANDTLEGMAGFLCKFAQDYLARAQIRCRLDVPETMPNVLLDSVQRHNLALAVKEAVHNAVRHGAPSEVLLGIATGGGRITITVRDNGRGFDTTRDVVKNHGSTNMRVRMEQMGGTFARQSVPGQGTTVVFTVPFTAPRSPS